MTKFKPIKRTGVEKGQPTTWQTDDGVVLGQKVKDLPGQAFELEDGHIARFGVVDDGVFRQFCSTAYCAHDKRTCIYRVPDTACRELHDDGTPRDKSAGRYFVEMTVEEKTEK